MEFEFKKEDREIEEGHRLPKKPSSVPMPEVTPPKKSRSKKKTEIIEPVISMKTPDDEEKEKVQEMKKFFFLINRILCGAIAVSVVVLLYVAVSFVSISGKLQKVAQEYDAGEYKSFSTIYKIPQEDVLLYLKYADISSKLYKIDKQILISIFKTSGFRINYRDTKSGLFGLCLINPVILAANKKESMDERGIFVAAKYLSENLKSRGFSDAIYVYFNYDQSTISRFLANYHGTTNYVSSNGVSK